MSWADKVHRDRQRQNAKDKHTVFCAQNFYAVLALSMWRIGYDEDQILEVLQKMDEVYGIEDEYINKCWEETGIKVVIE